MTTRQLLLSEFVKKVELGYFIDVEHLSLRKKIVTNNLCGRIERIQIDLIFDSSSAKSKLKKQMIEQYAEEIGEAGTNNNFDQTAIFGQRFDRKGNIIE